MLWENAGIGMPEWNAGMPGNAGTDGMPEESQKKAHKKIVGPLKSL